MSTEMGVFKNWKGSLYTMNVLIIKLLLCLGWLSSVALGQLELSEAVNGFVNFPEIGISCIDNLAVFITSVAKGRLDLEMGARDVLATIRGPKLYDINNRVGFTTYGAVFIGANKLPQTVRHTYGANNGAVFIAYEGSIGKWYDIHSMPPSIPLVLLWAWSCSDNCSHWYCFGHGLLAFAFAFASESRKFNGSFPKASLCSDSSRDNVHCLRQHSSMSSWYKSL